MSRSPNGIEIEESGVTTTTDERAAKVQYVKAQKQIRRHACHQGEAMKIIDDKEVGEMWKFWSELEVPDSVAASTEICKLIRKLVIERARNGTHIRGSKNMERALLDFNIHPTDWKDND